MRIALAVFIVIAVIAVILMRAAWTKRGETQEKVTSTRTEPPPVPDPSSSRGSDPPPGSRPDREQKGQP